MTITDFLLARIAEDDAAARVATPGPWEVKPNGDQPWVREPGSDYWLAITSADTATPKDSNAQHIARHDPARVLAECAAKRAIIAMYEQGDEAKGWDPEAYIASTVFDAMRALAAVYKDHPDYQQEWA